MALKTLITRSLSIQYNIQYSIQANKKCTYAVSQKESDLSY